MSATATLVPRPYGGYVVMVAGESVGEVWKVPGRQFSGAWRASYPDGMIRSRLQTRGEAVALLVGHHFRAINERN